MQKIIKMVGVERGTALINRLVKKRVDVDYPVVRDEEAMAPNFIQVKDSIDSVNENIKDLESLLEQGKFQKSKKQIKPAAIVKRVRQNKVLEAPPQR